MLMDGKKLSLEIEKSLKQDIDKNNFHLKVGIVYCGSSNIIDTYLSTKNEVADRIGVQMKIYRFQSTSTTEDLISHINNVKSLFDGIVIQLPLPKHIDKEKVLSAVPPEKDIDLLSQESYEKNMKNNYVLFPPVVGAVRELCSAYNIDIPSLSVAIVGKGKLVGKPLFDWITLQHPRSLKVYEKGDNLKDLSSADLIISGTGDPWSITPDMIKQGSIVIDAGTAVEEGVSKGDVHPDCAYKTIFFSPVPGGVGPLTVRILFKNLVTIIKSRS